MTVDDVPVEIYGLLCQLGLTANYTGFFHTAYAVHLASSAPRRLDRAIKYLYADVAEHYSTRIRDPHMEGEPGPAAPDRGRSAGP